MFVLLLIAYCVANFSLILEFSSTVQGDADGALDRLWLKKKTEIKQQ